MFANFNFNNINNFENELRLYIALNFAVKDYEEFHMTGNCVKYNKNNYEIPYVSVSFAII